jgi:HD-like signal output (HDOD) protein
MNDSKQNSSSSEADKLLERTIVELGIPPCPTILESFIAEMRKDEPDYNRLANIVGSDVGLSAGLIKTANSPFFGIRQRVRSGVEALAMLGMKTTTRVVAGLILRNTFPNVPNLEAFWDSSARISHLSGWLAQHLDIRGFRADDAHTFGLFRDCGIPVLLGHSKSYKAVLDLANAEAERSFTKVEEVERPINHAMVGNILAQSWYLPDEICLAIANHHDITALGSDSSKLPMLSRRLIATAQLAEHILQQQLGKNLNHEWAKLGTTCLKILDIEESQLETLYAEAESIVTTEV